MRRSVGLLLLLVVAWPSFPVWRMPAVAQASIDRQPREHARQVPAVTAVTIAQPSGDLHRPRRRRLVAARSVRRQRDDADAGQAGARRNERNGGDAPSAALAARLDDDDDRREPARSSHPRLPPRQSRNAPARADYQRRARGSRDLEHGHRRGARRSARSDSGRPTRRRR